MRAGAPGSRAGATAGGDRRRSVEKAAPERDQRRADRARRHCDIQRARPLRRPARQPLAGPDRRREHHEAKQQFRGAVPDREQSASSAGRREHTAAQRVGDDQEPQPIQQRVDAALQAGVGEVEEVERVGEDAERRRAAVPRAPEWSRPRRCARRSRLGGVDVDGRDHPARDPSQRDGDQREQNRARRPSFEGPGASAEARAASPRRAPSSPARRAEFRSTRQPEQRAEQARGSREGLAREQFAPRRADPRGVFVDLQQHRARRAQVSRRARRAWPSRRSAPRSRRRSGRGFLGFWGQLGQPFRRGVQSSGSVRRSRPAAATPVNRSRRAAERGPRRSNCPL